MEDIGACLEPTMGGPEFIWVYVFLKRWYHHVSVRAPNSSQLDMAKVTGDYVAMYRREEPPPPPLLLIDLCIPT